MAARVVSDHEFHLNRFGLISSTDSLNIYINNHAGVTWNIEGKATGASFNPIQNVMIGQDVMIGSSVIRELTIHSGQVKEVKDISKIPIVVLTPNQNSNNTTLNIETNGTLILFSNFYNENLGTINICFDPKANCINKEFNYQLTSAIKFKTNLEYLDDTVSDMRSNIVLSTCSKWSDHQLPKGLDKYVLDFIERLLSTECFYHFTKDEHNIMLSNETP